MRLGTVEGTIGADAQMTRRAMRFAMRGLQFHNGRIHTLHYVFLRGAAVLSDLEVLEMLGLTSYRSATEDVEFDRYVHITDDDEWVHVCDDLRYSLWHQRGLKDRLEACAHRVDVFWNVIGDVDESYSYSYWRSGELIRRRTVESPRFTDRVLVEDFGQPIGSESEELWSGSIYEIGFEVARTIGINVSHTGRAVRQYGLAESKPPRSRDEALRGSITNIGLKE